MALTLYGIPASGHVHAVRLLLSMLEIDHDTTELDGTTREARGERFRKVNPFGQAPVIDDDGFVVRDSHAILVYLARRYDPTNRWYPIEPKPAARVQEWLATSTIDLVLGPARARAAVRWGRPFDLEGCQKLAHQLFRIMDDHVATREWLATDDASIADLSCYPYVVMAPQGGVALEAYPKLQDWLRRVEALPRFLPAPPPPNG